MLAHEWRELEDLCERIGALRERLAAAHKTGNTGFIEGLNAEIDGAIRQRERLVRHISTRLGSAAAIPATAPGSPLAGERQGTGRHAASMPARD
jgi:hypothetical protein